MLFIGPAAELRFGHHVGTVTGGCGGATSVPAGFQVQSVTSSTLQPEFVSGARLTYVLGIFEPGVGAASEPVGCSNIYAGQSIHAGHSFASCDSRFRLVVSASGHIALVEGAHELWSVGASGGAGAAATMRADGNFVLTDGSGRVVWDTGTASPGARAQIQDDGNFVIVDLDNHAVWASETCCH